MKLRLPALFTPLLAPGVALAHQGHGLPGVSHWHASDSAGFVLLALAVVLLVWWARRK